MKLLSLYFVIYAVVAFVFQKLGMFDTFVNNDPLSLSLSAVIFFFGFVGFPILIKAGKLLFPFELSPKKFFKVFGLGAVLGIILNFTGKLIMGQYVFDSYQFCLASIVLISYMMTIIEYKKR